MIAPIAWVNSWHADDNRKMAMANADDIHRQIATAVGRTYLTVLLSHREVEVACARARQRARALRIRPHAPGDRALATASTTRARSRSCAPTRRS